ncbi:hypothetical protein B0E48_06825 [Rhodanobacter sp. C03]|nr:hypothetical protein B0E48_06825 [Rhodanobacter sp. C03]
MTVNTLVEAFFEVPAVRLATSGRLRAANNTICEFFSKRFLRSVLQMYCKRLSWHAIFFSKQAFDPVHAG